MRGLWIGAALMLAMTAEAASPHVVEELTFRVAPEDQQRFLELDRQIWTETLSREPGYLGKETWLASRPKDEIKLVIRWRSRKDWNRVSKELLKETDERFQAAMGKDRYEMLRGRAFRTVGAEPVGGAFIGIDAVLTAERLRLAQVVEVERDPVYFRKKRYLAVPLAPIIKQLTDGLSEDRLDRAEVVFDCADDYHSRMPLEEALADDGWIAFRDLDADDGKQWTTPKKGPRPVQMGRGYVVWTGVEKPMSRTWPYGIERVRLELSK